ncbi:SGNH/GDSL hydrolase family protein [Aeromonas sp. JL9]|uniref:SGNH/GDSL hydrolase family protein n=1 Tax=Aeromonas sp. JL9 TaxID=2950549 RepID=UPI00210A202A|nr:SGNH/GDSL hydrolase family protein [Aeromonas sp. JL9]MCQ4108099.1 hypothetical protein [Aeromonas sp. JL9]
MAYWPDTGTGVDVEPARKPVQSALRKYFSEGGPGVPPTVPGGDWFNQMTNEVLNVLEAAGIEPSKIDDNQLITAIEQLISGVVDNLESRLESDGSSIEDIAATPKELERLHVFNAANYGVVDGASDDQTTKLNNCIADAISAGATDVWLNSDIKCLGRVTNPLDVTLRGGGSISKHNPENYQIDVLSDGHLLPAVSSSVRSFTQFQRALRKGTITVVLVGDSISTSNPDTLTGTDDLTTYLEKQIKLRYPGITVKFYNRAIGGATMEAFNAPNLPNYLRPIASVQAPWYTDFNQPWFEYVSSLSPDLVILAFGMNGENTIGLGFTSLNEIWFKFNGLAKFPSIAYVTTPTPTGKTESSYSTFSAQSTRNHFAEMARVYAGIKGEAVIDVNRLQQATCYGADPWFYSKKETTLIQTGTASESDDALIFQTYSRFFSAYFKLIPGSNPLQIQFNYNHLEPVNLNNSVIIYGSEVILYTGTRELARASITTTGSYHSFKLHHDRSKFELLMDGVVVLSGNYTFEHYFDSNVLFSAGPLKKDVRLFEFLPQKVSKTLTPDQAWGQWTSDSSVGTKPLIGGNSVNHPSTLGLSAFYKPAVDNFVGSLPMRDVRDTIFNTPSASGPQSLLSGRKFSDYSHCIFVFGNPGIGVPMCQSVPKEVLVNGYIIQQPIRTAAGAVDGLINIAINSDNTFTLSKSGGGTNSNQLGLIIGII